MPLLYTNSPNMGLLIPTVGQETGPEWASDLNNSLLTVDQHDHSTGSGVAITPAGLNINSDLSIASNNLLSVLNTRFTVQTSADTSAANRGSLSVVANAGSSGINDLYYIDGNGSAIAITTNGSVNGGAGSISGLPSGTASASFASGTFTFNQATSTRANLDLASAVLRNSTASSFGLTLSPPSLTSSYTLTLPGQPLFSSASAPAIMTMDTSGAMSTSVRPDDSTITVSSSIMKVKDAGITTVKIATANITQALLAPKPNGGATAGVGSVAISSSSGAYTSSSTSLVDVTNLSVTLTTTGRPVVMFLNQIAGSGNSYLGITTGTSGPIAGSYAFSVNGFNYPIVNISSPRTLTNPPFASFYEYHLSPACAFFFDIPPAGTYTFTFRAAVDAGTPGNFLVNNVTLTAYEI